MIRRTAVLLGTLALVCVAESAAAQRSRPRYGRIVSAPVETRVVTSEETPTEPTPSLVGIPRAHVERRGAPKPRIGLIIPAPQSVPAQDYATTAGFTAPFGFQSASMQSYPTTADWSTTVFGPLSSTPTGSSTVSQVAAFYYLPAVQLSDGRVFADFNGRYEQVLRRCPVTTGPIPPGFGVSTCWVVDSYGRYKVIHQR